MKTKIQIFLLFIIPIFCFNQTKYDKFDDLIDKADSLRKISSFKEAFKNYNMALKTLNPDSATPFFDAAFCGIKLNEKERAIDLIKRGVSVGGAQLEYLKSYEGFKYIQTEKFYLDILNEYEFLRKKYFSSIPNIDVYLEIEKLHERDQTVRKFYSYLNEEDEMQIAENFKNYKIAIVKNDTVLIKKYQKLVFLEIDGVHNDLLNVLMKKVDKLNTNRLIEITKIYGWQPRAWTILWHHRNTYTTNNEVWSYFKPLINKEINEGKLSRRFWAPFNEHVLYMESFRNNLNKLRN